MYIYRVIITDTLAPLHRRNDPIKHVREAAELALHQIGGPQSATAIKVTAVLCAEIDRLKDNEF